MTSSRQIVRLLMAADEPCFKKLTETLLKELCSRLQGTAALFHVIDGQKILLKDKFSTDDDVNMDFPFIYGSASESLCLSERPPTRKSSQRNESSRPTCTLALVFHDAGFQSHACVPLCLKSTTIGVLSVLSKAPKQFTEADLGFMDLLGKQFVLALHHSAYFPEITCDWANFIETQARTWGKPKVSHQSSSNNPQIIQVEDDGLLNRVLARQKANGPSNASATIGSLPKGISLPTLKRVCEVLQEQPGRISRKTLAATLGFSDVTAGHYLKYLASLGMLEELTAYGSVGRPTFMYVLERTPPEDVGLRHPCPFDWKQHFSQ